MVRVRVIVARPEILAAWGRADSLNRKSGVRLAHARVHKCNLGGRRFRMTMTYLRLPCQPAKLTGIQLLRTLRYHLSTDHIVLRTHIHPLSILRIS